MALEDYFLITGIISAVIVILWFFLLFRIATLLEEIQGDTRRIMELLEWATDQMEKEEK